MRKRKVINNAHPQFIGNTELLRSEAREFFQLKKCDRGQHRAPDFLQIPCSKLEGINQRLHVDTILFLRLMDPLAPYRSRPRSSYPLPIRSIFFHFKKDGTYQAGQRSTQLDAIGLTSVTHINMDLTELFASDRRHSCRPKDLLRSGFCGQ